MTKTLLGLTLLLTLTACTTAHIRATPLKEQSATQIEADRKRCDEWSKTTAYVRTGYAACLVAAGYETTPQVGSSSETMRLAGAATTTELTRVFLDVLECDSQAQQEVERGLGMISTWIRDHLKWRYNVKKRRQLFVDCLKPRGYEIGKS